MIPTDAITKSLGAATDIIDLDTSQVRVVEDTPIRSPAIAEAMANEGVDEDTKRLNANIKYASETIRETIETAADGLSQLMLYAEDQQCPKMYSAAAQYMANIANMSKMLVEVANVKKVPKQEVAKELVPQTVTQNNVTNNNYMSATEMLKDI